VNRSSHGTSYRSSLFYMSAPRKEEGVIMAEDIFLDETLGDPGEVLSKEDIENRGELMEDVEIPYDGNEAEDLAIMQEVNGDINEPVATTKSAEPADDSEALEGIKECISILRNGTEPDLAKKSRSALREPADPVELADNSAPAAGSHVLQGQETTELNDVDPNDKFPSISMGSIRGMVVKSVITRKDDSDDTNEEVVDKFPSVKL